MKNMNRGFNSLGNTNRIIEIRNNKKIHLMMQQKFYY